MRSSVTYTPILFYLILLSLLSVNTAPAAVAQSPEPDAAPEQIRDGWRTAAPAEVGMGPARLEELTRSLRRGEHGNVHALLIEKDGRLVYEEYFTGADETWGVSLGTVTFGRASLYDIRSAAKSVVSTLIGIAIGRGEIPSVEARLRDLPPEYTALLEGDKAELGQRHVLSMSAGLVWDEWSRPYSHPQNPWGQLTRAADPVAFLLDRELVHEPGSSFTYNTSLTYMLAVILEACVRGSEPSRARVLGPAAGWGSAGSRSQRRRRGFSGGAADGRRAGDPDELHCRLLPDRANTVRLDRLALTGTEERCPVPSSYALLGAYRHGGVPAALDYYDDLVDRADPDYLVGIEQLSDFARLFVGAGMDIDAAAVYRYMARSGAPEGAVYEEVADRLLSGQRVPEDRLHCYLGDYQPSSGGTIRLERAGPGVTVTIDPVVGIGGPVRMLTDRVFLFDFGGFIGELVFDLAESGAAMSVTVRESAFGISLTAERLGADATGVAGCVAGQSL